MSYRPDIDGLRAVAVLSVLFYHAHLGFPGGYVGVDVFFVISGFLITGLLLKAIAKGTFSYVDFWERRVRRLVPALAVVTIFTAIASYFILLPEDLEDLGGALIAQPLLLSNVYFWRVVQRGYFGDPPEIRPLLHTWSLGVEEQFYVLFPLLLMLILTRRTLASQVGKILTGLALASLALAIVLTPSRGVLSFFTLPTRAWELLLGGLIALKLSNSSQPSLAIARRSNREFLALLGLGMIAGSVLFYHHETPFPGYAALIPCLGTALILWANSHKDLTVVGKLFSHPAMVRIGQISYSLYLWHWPLIACGTYLFLLDSTEARWLVVVLSCWLGYLSWRWIEAPFRDKRLLPSRRAIFGLFLAYAATCLCSGVAFRLLDGVTEHSSSLPQKPTMTRINDLDIETPILKLPSLGESGEARTSFLLWGDSHAMSLAPILDILGKEHKVRGIQLTNSSKAPLMDWGYVTGLTVDPVSEEFKKKWAHKALEVARSQKIQVVFLVGFWKVYSGSNFPAELQRTIQEFNQIGVRVVFVGDNPEQSTDPQRQSRLALRWDWIPRPTSISIEEHKLKNSAVYEAFREQPANNAQLTVIDLAPSVIEWNGFLSQDGHVLYYDTHHLSDAGALQLRPLFEPIFEELGTTSRSGGAKSILCVGLPVYTTLLNRFEQRS